MNENRNIAKRLARQQWGQINSEEKVVEGCWWFSCASHGGFIVDINKVELPVEVADTFSTIVKKRANSKKYRPHEQHFAVFEEDSAYVILLYYNKEIAREWYMADRWLPAFYDRFLTFNEYFEFIEEKMEKNFENLM